MTIYHNADPNQRLDRPASTGLVLISMEIYIQYQDCVYVLLKHPFYFQAGAHLDESSTGMLYPPFIGKSFSCEMYAPESLREFVEETEKVLERFDVGRAIKETAYIYGLGSLQIEHRGTLYEIKDSPSFNGERRLYRIERYFCTPRSETNIKNLTDPQCLKGHFFLPIRGNSRDITKVRRFKGIEVVENYRYVLSLSGELDALARRAIATDRADWVLTYTGFILLIDVAGFGRLSQNLTTKHGNIFEDGSALTRRLTSDLADAFENLLLMAETFQSYFAGDGILVGIPTFSDKQRPVDALHQFLERYRGLVDQLNALNKRVDEPGMRLGSRLTVHFSEYDFGRIGGPLSTSANFSGEGIVELARCEAGLSAVEKARGLLGVHLLGVTREAFAAISEVQPDSELLKDLNSETQQVKERNMQFWAKTIENSQ